MLILSALIFLAVTLALAGFFVWVTPSRAEERLQGLAGTKEKSNWTETIVKIAGPLAKLSTPEGDWENSPLRLRFLHAGIRNPDARLLYFGAKTVLPLALAGLTYMAFRGDGGPDVPFLYPDCRPDRLLPAQPGDIPVDQVAPAGNIRDLSRCSRPDAGLRGSRAGAGRRPDPRSRRNPPQEHGPGRGTSPDEPRDPGRRDAREVPAQPGAAHGRGGNRHICHHADAGRQVRHQHRRFAAGFLRRLAAQAPDTGRGKRRQGTDQDAVPAGDLHLSRRSSWSSWVRPIIQIVRTILPMLGMGS